MLKGDKKSQAVECMVQTLICSVQSCVQSDGAKNAMDVHMWHLQQQIQRGVEDMFRFAESVRAPDGSQSDIRTQNFPFLLRNAKWFFRGRSESKKK